MLPIQHQQQARSPLHSPVNTPAADSPVGTPQAGSPDDRSPATTPVAQILRAPMAPPGVRRTDRQHVAPLHPALLWAVPAAQGQVPVVNPVVAHNIQNLMAPLIPGHIMLPVPQHAIFHHAAPPAGVQLAPAADPLLDLLAGLQPVNAPRAELRAPAPERARNRNLLAAFDDALRAAENAGLAPETPEPREGRPSGAASR